MSRKIRTTDGEPFDFENGLKVRGQDISTMLATEANDARIKAEQARDAAVLASGIYATTAAGIAAVQDGKYFSVPATDNINSLILYKRSGTVAVEVNRYPTLSASLNKSVASALRFPKQKSFLVENGLQRYDGGQTGHGIYDVWAGSAFNNLPIATDPFLLNCGVYKEIPSGSKNSGFNAGYFNLRSLSKNAHVSKIISKKKYVYSLLVRFEDNGYPRNELKIYNDYMHYYRNINGSYSYGPLSIGGGVKQLTENIYLFWAIFNPKKDINTTNGTDMQLQWPYLNFSGPARTWIDANPDLNICYFSLPCLFEFNENDPVDIETCDYLSHVDYYQKFNAFNLDKALFLLEQLEKQNNTIRDFSNGDNYLRLGANSGSFAYYTANRPFIDLMKTSHQGWFSPTWDSLSNIDANLHNDEYGWIKNLPPGKRIYKYVLIHSFMPDFRPGKYYITWEGQGEVLVINQPGVNQNYKVINSNKVSIELLPITETSTSLPENITLIVNNNTTIPLSINKIHVYHEDDEQDFLNGEIFQKDWLRIHGAVHCLRLMDFVNANFSTVQNTTDFLTEQHCSWGSEYVVKTLPPSIIGKLWSKLNNDIWVNIPHKLTNDAILFMAQEIKNNYNGLGKIYVEYSNETWNGMFPVYNYLNGLRSSLGVSTVAQATAVKSAICWEIFDSVFGRENVVHVYCGQVVNGNYALGCNLMYNGYNIKDKVDLYGGAPYFSLSGGMGLPTVITTKSLLEEKRYLEPDTWWYQGCVNVLATIENWFKANQTAISQLNADGNSNIRFTTYEGGHHFEVPYERNYGCSINVNDNTITITGISDASIAFDDGDEIIFSYAPNVEAFVGANHYTPYPIKRVSGNSYHIYSSKQDYLNNTPVTLKTTSIASSYGIGNATRTNLLFAKIKAFLSSQYGKKAYIDYITLMRKYKIEQFQQYFLLGGWSGDGLILSTARMWGMLQHIGDVSPRAKWYLDLCKNNPNGLPPYIEKIEIPSYF